MRDLVAESLIDVVARPLILTLVLYAFYAECMSSLTARCLNGLLLELWPPRKWCVLQIYWNLDGSSNSSALDDIFIRGSTNCETCAALCDTGQRGALPTQAHS